MTTKQKKYYMYCGKCGIKINVGTDKIIYRMYECLNCKTLNYPME